MRRFRISEVTDIPEYFDIFEGQGEFEELKDEVVSIFCHILNSLSRYGVFDNLKQLEEAKDKLGNYKSEEGLHYNKLKVFLFGSLEDINKMIGEETWGEGHLLEGQLSEIHEKTASYIEGCLKKFSKDADNFAAAMIAEQQQAAELYERGRMIAEASLKLENIKKRRQLDILEGSSDNRCNKLIRIDIEEDEEISSLSSGSPGRDSEELRSTKSVSDVLLENQQEPDDKNNERWLERSSNDNISRSSNLKK